jgi:hypothetical protein
MGTHGSLYTIHVAINHTTQNSSDKRARRGESQQKKGVNKLLTDWKMAALLGVIYKRMVVRKIGRIKSCSNCSSLLLP